MKCISAVFYLAFVAAALCGCDDMPGRPKPGPEVPRPEQILSFDRLYGDNCAGCHGADGENGPATDLSNPEYQSWIDDATLRNVIANGENGTMMPGFTQAAGGSLTDEQVDSLVKGIRSHWRDEHGLQGLSPPPYKPSGAGNSQHGEQVYSAVCARCHGANGGPTGRSGSVLDGSLLALISPQALRTTIVTGRPDFGMPDWRNQNPGHPLTDQDVTDVVAWIMAQRPPTPGQPYPQTSNSQSKASKTGGS